MTHTTARRLRSAVFAGIGLAALAVLVLLWTDRHGALEQPAANASETGAVRPASQQGFPPAVLDPRADLSASPEHVEVCGIGWVKMKRFDDPFPQSTYAAADKALDSAAASLIANGTGPERAAALYIRRATAWFEAMEAHRLKHPKCDEDEGCSAAARQAARDAAQRTSTALAQHGLATLDPKVYALAYYACGHGLEGDDPKGDCSRYTAARWTQLEPQNLVPWLYLASYAQSRNDERARDEALQRASRATYADYHNRSVFALFEQREIQTLDPGARLAAITRVTGVWAAFAIPNVRPMIDACAPASIADPDRRKMCSDMGRVLTTGASDLLLYSIGITLGERAGWPKDQIVALRNRKEALQLVSSVLPENPWSCESMRKWEAHYAGLLRHGELVEGDRLIAATGRSTAELAAESRRRSR